MNDTLNSIDTNSGLDYDANDPFAIPPSLDRRKPAQRDKAAASGSSSKRRKPRKAAKVKAPAKKRASAPKPAAKARGRECPKSLKPRKGEKSGAFIQRAILEGLLDGITDKAFANHILKFYPEQKTTHKDVAWNRWKLRQDGKLAKL